MVFTILIASLYRSQKRIPHHLAMIRCCADLRYSITVALSTVIGFHLEFIIVPCQIDFKKHMMLVVGRTNSMYVPPRIVAVERKRQSTGASSAGWTSWKTIVKFELPDLGDSKHAASPKGVGSYHAVIVDLLAEVKKKSSQK
eukprot:1320999-Amorphochlora_amoeboformis.AAC.3